PSFFRLERFPPGVTYTFVIAGLVPAIHVFDTRSKTSMPGTRPSMTSAENAREAGSAQMAEGEPRRIGFSIEVKPHAYDPATNPELFEGVLARRVIAFFIDLVILSVPILVAGFLIAVLGLLTFGLGWLLFFALPAA